MQGAVLASLVAAAMTVTPSIPADKPPSAGELQRYAAALVDVVRAERTAQNGGAAAIAGQAVSPNAALVEVIKRHGFSRNRFNAISTIVEHDRALRRDVRTMAMRDRIGF